MLIDLEDYRNRCRLRACVEPLRVAAGGAWAAAVAHAPARMAAPLYALSTAAFADPVMPSVSELAGLFAGASLI